MARSDLFAVEAPGVGKLARDFNRAERRAQDKVNRSVRSINRLAEVTYKEHAPVDTGDLRESIRGSIFYRGHVVRATLRARAVRNGFNYLPVTRYGHRVSLVRPKRAQAMTVHAHGRHAQPVVRRSVRGYFPARDWAEVAGRSVSRQTRATARLLGRDLATTIKRGR